MIRRTFASALRAAAVLLAATLSAAASPDDLRVELDGDLLSLEARAVPLEDVLRVLAGRSGFELTLNGDFSEPVSIVIKRKPVWQALERLVRDINHVVVYAPARVATDAHQVAQLWLFGAGDAAPRSAAPGSSPDQPGGPPQDRRPADDGKNRSLAALRLANGVATADALRALDALLRDDPEPLVRGRAAVALGALGDSRALPALESALLDAHASVRAQAIGALGQIGGDGATAVLGEFALSGADGGQRALAVRALWRQDSELAQHYLDAAADDPDARVRAESKAPPKAAPDRAGDGQPEFENTR